MTQNDAWSRGSNPHCLILLTMETVFVIMIPALLFLSSDAEVTAISYLGLVVWIFGLFVETVADIQKFNFSKRGKGKWIASGLWKYSRHPNYFGEILCWVGIYLFTFSSLSVAGKFLGLLSPVFISFLLIFVSGIPILEKYADKKWGKDKEYRRYKKRTSVLIPWFVGK